MTTDMTRAAVNAYFGAVTDDDREAFVSLFTEEVEFADPADRPAAMGHEGVARFHKGLKRAWDHLTMTPSAVHVRGDRAAASWTAAGRSASGSDISFDGINLFRVAPDGRIAHVEGYWDFEGVIAQMS